MKLDTIWQYPVKSMIGGTVESAELDEVGIVGDRTWAVRDEDAGVIANTRKLGGLMRFAARYSDGGSVTIRAGPPGQPVAATRCRAARLLPAGTVRRWRHDGGAAHDLRTRGRRAAA